VSACRSCRAPVWRLRNDNTGNTAPIEQRADPTGNVLVDLDAGTYHVLGRPADRLAARAAGMTLHRNHFAGCPQARQWARPRAHR